jgi:6-pyruvoyltetrahydropterin/6-carboxytetrahydropterin synthase
MYEVTVLDEFVAQHFLTVPNPPAGEGEPHSHRFEVELTFRGDELNEYDYLVDIDDVEAALRRLNDRYSDALLNDLPEFDGDNPSVERFARVVWDRVTDEVTDGTVEAVAVTVWEDEQAHAAYDAAV